MTAIQVDHAELMAGMVATRERAARERTAAEVKSARADLNAASAARSVEQEQKAAVPAGNPADWIMLGDLIAGPVLRDIVAPNWRLTADEVGKLSGHICKVLAHYFPDAEGFQSHPVIELAAAFVVIGYSRREQVERGGQVITQFRPMRAGLKEGLTIDDSADGGTDGRADDPAHRDHPIGEDGAGVTTMPG